MRLPESVTKIAPVGAVLTAGGVGETLLRTAKNTADNRLFVTSADSAGLSDWEKDYGLADGTGQSAEQRRARLRGAMAGGQTLTRERLVTLAKTVGGAETVSVTESFGAYSVSVEIIGEGKMPSAATLAPLREAVEAQKPAHLSVTVSTCALLCSERGETRHGGMLSCRYGAVAE